MSRWRDAAGQGRAHAEVIDDLAAARVVLLGERHDRADHHRWQLHVAAGLAARRPVVMGFEMFPASADPVLADWVAGSLGEEAFLERVGWGDCWGFPAELYLPIFRFCREMGIGMRGLNVPRGLVRAVGAGGWEAVPESDRDGLSPAGPSPPAYRRFIFELTGGARPDRAATSAEDPAFNRFLRAQEVWDRAFATRIAAAAALPGGPLVIGIIGMGHLQYGGGVSWQLRDLGMSSVKVAIPEEEAVSPDPDRCDWSWTSLPVPD
ncbi:ChaN family lipoprotein [Mangrovicoccus algicola]|uniref:ChaN family lipoprotein n=1 Tax=Mangrovicoccus algicola TaxID=2771008 RepID=A0A8J7CKH0_9RHOB|nr:ChaN family lipoprotein [Mangrovicoccus algicola]MBE3638806.1 ChaN family lipoprotein [Mangrovicoccus algicola]